MLHRFVLVALCVSSSCAVAEPISWHGLRGELLATGELIEVSPDFSHVHVLPASRDAAELGFQQLSLSVSDRAFALSHGNPSSEFQKTSHAWTSDNGKYHVDAKAIAVDGTKVLLRRAEDKVISVELSRLSESDRSFLKRLSDASKPPQPKIDDPFSTVESFTGFKPTQLVETPARTVQPVTSPTPDSTGDPARVDTSEVTVYVTTSGKKYHNAGCRYLSKSSIPMALSKAALGYEPCSACHPPVKGGSGLSSNNSVDAPRMRSTPTASNKATASDFVDRNPDNETVTGQTATGIPTFTGYRGGHYHYSKSGKKVYEKKK
jgi:hypothetical protein